MKTRKLCLFGVSFLLITLGLIFILISPVVLKYVISSNLVLTPFSETTAKWRHIPEPVPMDIYLFNWTNPEEIYNNGTPILEQVGPYRFMLDLQKVDVVWNKNGTVTYKQQKFWYFSEKGTNGSLQDVITVLNTPPLGAAHIASTWNYVVRKGLSITLSSASSQIYVTRTVDELLFSGFYEPVTAMASTLPVFADQDIPRWDKFAFFYKSNGSSGMDGIYTIGTGVGTTFGKMYAWNHWTQSPYYEGECGKIDGFSGDNFELNDDDTIKMFLPDLCRGLTLQYTEDSEVGGITGRKYVIGDNVLDNGTKYPKNQCYCGGECPPSGIFNISSCQYGSPAFLSLPHFYQADPYYTSSVEGLQPEKDKHEFFIVVEPNTGIPLQFNSRLQLNFLLHSVPDITQYESVPKIYFPLLWFEQRATVPKDDLENIKLLLYIPIICKTFGGLMMLGGAGLLIYLLFAITMDNNKHKRRKVNGEDVPLRSANASEKT